MRYGIVTKIFHFESAHHLPGHRGKCAHLHGHSYRLEVTIRGPIKDMSGASDHGMVMDFDDLSGTVKNSVIERLDHRDLNEVTGKHTTDKNLVQWKWTKLNNNVFSQELLYRIRLGKTESGYVEITKAERG